MGNISKEQREALALIDAVLAITEKNPEEASINAGISVNPFDFIMDIIQKKVTFEEMLEWLSNFITKELPIIELGVKGILLSNLKSMVDCNNDPRIPNWLRKDYSGYTSYLSDESSRKNGFLFDLRAIDYKNMLSVSPLSEFGNEYYFGCNTYYTIDGDTNEGKKYFNRNEAIETCVIQGLSASNITKVSECDNIYKLARANDFNAYLWFVVHKGFFPIVIPFKDIQGTIKNGAENSLSVIEGEEELTVENRQPKVGVGNSVQENHFFSLCIETESELKKLKPIEPYNDEFYGSGSVMDEVVAVGYAPRKYKYKIVPVSSDNKSVNWYVNSGTFFNFLLPEEQRIPRDYNKDYPICNLQYIEKVSNLNDILYDNIRFTILPKPFIHLPRKGEPLWRVKPILFNDKGEPSDKGRYSVLVSNSTPTVIEEEDRIVGYEYELKSGSSLIIDAETGAYALSDTSHDALERNLYECYPKLTVYEFNYDFVMGMQLFDPTVVASQLIETVTNLKHTSVGRVGLNLGVNKSETAYQMRISEIVKKIIESTAYEVSDCFYSFDNKKYDAMLREAELKRSRMHVDNDGNDSAKQYSNEEILSILNEFDNNATLNENKEVIKRAITQATATITQEVLPEDRYSIQLNIIQELIKSLVSIIVETLISPKIVLLLEVNRRLMGMEDKHKYNIESFLNSVEGLLVSIIRELRDLILQKLLDWCMSILNELFDSLKDLLIKEQLEYYSRLMKLLFNLCSFKASHRAALDSELDFVNYADIDEIDKPQESKC